MSKNAVVARRLAKAFVSEAFQLVLDPPACVTLDADARERYLEDSLLSLRRTIPADARAKQGVPSHA